MRKHNKQNTERNARSFITELLKLAGIEMTNERRIVISIDDGIVEITAPVQGSDYKETWGRLQPYLDLIQDLQPHDGKLYLPKAKDRLASQIRLKADVACMAALSKNIKNNGTAMKALLKNWSPGRLNAG